MTDITSQASHRYKPLPPKKGAPRIAIVEDGAYGAQLVMQLLDQAGASVVQIPRTLDDEALKQAGLKPADIEDLWRLNIVLSGQLAIPPSVSEALQKTPPAKPPESYVVNPTRMREMLELQRTLDRLGFTLPQDAHALFHLEDALTKQNLSPQQREEFERISNLIVKRNVVTEHHSPLRPVEQFIHDRHINQKDAKRFIALIHTLSQKDTLPVRLQDLHIKKWLLAENKIDLKSLAELHQLYLVMEYEKLNTDRLEDLTRLSELHARYDALDPTQVEKLRAEGKDRVVGYALAIAQATQAHVAEVKKILDGTDGAGGIDAFVFPGNYYDIPPSSYQEAKVHHETIFAPPLDVRYATERFMLGYAMDPAHQKPFIGICAGLQLLVAETGGRLIQYIPELKTGVNHETPASNSARTRDKFARGYSKAVKEGRGIPGPAGSEPHYIEIVEQGSILGEIVKHARLANRERPEKGEGFVETMCRHKQGAFPTDISGSLIVTARADDGIVEGVEIQPGIHPFGVALQNHPEPNLGRIALPLIEALVQYTAYAKTLPPKNLPHYLEWEGRHNQPSQQLGEVRRR